MDPARILSIIGSSGKKGLSFKELSRSLGVSAAKKRSFRSVIRRLREAGEIKELAGKRYVLPSHSDLLEGRLRIRANGSGVVEVEGTHPLTITIPEQHMRRGFLPNDIVRVDLDRKQSGHRVVGRIVSVVAHSTRPVAGIARPLEGSHRWIVDYIDEDVPLRILIEAPPSKALKDHVVLVRMNPIQDARAEPSGTIVQDLGPISDPLTDFKWLLHRYELSTRFPKKITDELKAIPDSIPNSEIKRRRDLREDLIVTIDGEDARDFDDAVGLIRTEDGYRLTVSIADVSFYVRMGTDLYHEAERRATSTYFPDHVIPMLPLRLSSDLCSLRESEDRLTLTVEMDIAPSGELLRTELYPSVIRSAKRLTYTQVYTWLSSTRFPTDLETHPRGEALFRMLADMRHLSQAIRENRFRRGAINLDIPEVKFGVDRKGITKSVFLRQSNFAHQLIEEFMILANEAVSEIMTKKGIAHLYRIHEDPDPAKVEQLNRLLSAFGFTPIESISEPEEVNALVEKFRYYAVGRELNFQLLRCLKQARYSPHNVGHFGLASPTYAHFTSPIRRFPDLLLHQAVWRRLFNREEISAITEVPLLEQLGEHCSTRERDAMEAEREYQKMKAARYIEKDVGKRFQARIVSVTSFGLFVELAEVPIEGLIRLAEMKDDFYVYHEDSQSILGQRRRRRFRLGQTITVVLTEAHPLRRRIRFRIERG